MKFKVLYILAIIGLMSYTSNAQRGVRIGYIDTEFILQNVPEYQEASSQLDQKIEKWKAEIDQRLKEVEQKKQALENEKVLLTKELYEERFEDITYEEAEILDYQQKRFGPNGDMIIQRNQLIQPVQDQIFSAVQEIATNRKYDFVFDKSADVVMLYSAERYDISEQVLRTITRASNRKQAETRKERRELEEEEVVPEEVSPEREARAQALEDKKAEREAQLEERRKQREAQLEERRKAQEDARQAKRKEIEERRKKATEARSGGKAKDTSEVAKAKVKVDSTKAKTAVKTDSTKTKTRAQLLEEKREKAKQDREARQKALEERRKKILEDRKKAREEREAQIKKNDSIRKAKAGGGSGDEGN
ncbi:OmpH family outer membrane protein [Winogradskyella maritima]|uniref:OmpH family outer membrane protein n=1 Tax=Winogradskyella maritima TaxID=1517766 RepID=A0ABV8ACT4_9FLAO|nr:OmpH family outer membrane protein [Winogradskyella maritima]